jgi:hypothetical protein
VTLPTPEPGLVIRYSYLWRAEHLAGREEGIKDRPCAIVMAINHERRDKIVSVLPITHTPPLQPTLALEIPEPTKRRLGLDSERSWIVFSESNRFVWPGPDLRPLPGEPLSTIAYGMLPPNFFNVLRERYLAAIRAHRSRTVPRSL